MTSKYSKLDFLFYVKHHRRYYMSPLPEEFARNLDVAEDEHMPPHDLLTSLAVEFWPKIILRERRYDGLYIPLNRFWEREYENTIDNLSRFIHEHNLPFTKHREYMSNRGFTMTWIMADGTRIIEWNSASPVKWFNNPRDDKLNWETVKANFWFQHFIPAGSEWSEWTA